MILVIDDELAIRTLIRTVLEEHGYQVLEAADGTEGLRMVHEQPVKLVITDVVMPNKGGIELLMELRKEFKNLAIILMSGKIETDADSFQELAAQFGVLAVLTKPFKMSRLLAVVEQSLNR